MLGQPNTEHLILIDIAKLLLQKADVLIWISHSERELFDVQTDKSLILGNLRQEDHKFKDFLGYRVSLRPAWTT